jgi:hypothetical protein
LTGADTDRRLLACFFVLGTALGGCKTCVNVRSVPSGLPDESAVFAAPVEAVGAARPCPQTVSETRNARNLSLIIEGLQVDSSKPGQTASRLELWSPIITAGPAQTGMTAMFKGSCFAPAPAEVVITVSAGDRRRVVTIASGQASGPGVVFENNDFTITLPEPDWSKLKRRTVGTREVFVYGILAEIEVHKPAPGNTVLCTIDSVDLSSAH